MQHYKYIIIGGGVCGCSVAYELSQYTKSVLVLEKNKDVALEASGAAGGFLSPLLGKPNSFKDLVTQALIYSTDFYKKNFQKEIITCGTIRIPKDQEDTKKFDSYKPHMDFEYTQKEDGYFFPIGSVLNSYNICKKMIENIDTTYNYEAKKIVFDKELWNIDDKFTCENLILTTGYNTHLLQEPYLQIRAVWGRRIEVTTTTKVDTNYHKRCSISKSKQIDTNKHLVSIGATHHRDKKDLDKTINHKELLDKSSEILKLENIEIIKDHIGARASSFDYFPIIGPIIDSKKTLKEFPYLTHGTNVQPQRFTRYKQLYLINGVGGRGFVLAPYLANKLALYLEKNKDIDQFLTSDRLFKRYVKKLQT